HCYFRWPAQSIGFAAAQTMDTKSECSHIMQGEATILIQTATLYLVTSTVAAAASHTIWRCRIHCTRASGHLPRFTSAIVHSSIPRSLLPLCMIHVVDAHKTVPRNKACTLLLSKYVAPRLFSIGCAVRCVSTSAFSIVIHAE